MHSYEEYNKLIQELINMMNSDYPYGYELIINSFGAQIKLNKPVQTFIKENLNFINSKKNPLENCLDLAIIADTFGEKDFNPLNPNITIGEIDNYFEEQILTTKDLQLLNYYKENKQDILNSIISLRKFSNLEDPHL